MFLTCLDGQMETAKVEFTGAVLADEFFIFNCQIIEPNPHFLYPSDIGARAAQMPFSAVFILFSAAGTKRNKNHCGPESLVLSLFLFMWSPHVSTSLRCPSEFQQCFIQHLPPFSHLYLVLFCFVSIVSVWGTCAVTSMMLSSFNSTSYSRHPLSSRLLLGDWAEQRKNSSLTF